MNLRVRRYRDEHEQERAALNMQPQSTAHGKVNKYIEEELTLFR